MAALPVDAQAVNPPLIFRFPPESDPGRRPGQPADAPTVCQLVARVHALAADFHAFGYSRETEWHRSMPSRRERLARQRPAGLAAQEKAWHWHACRSGESVPEEHEPV